MELSLQAAFLAEMLTLLILLAGAMLLYGSFREKYLLSWIAGWTALCLARTSLSLGAGGGHGPLWMVLAHVAYIVALGLFTTSVLMYVAQVRLLWLAFACLALALPLDISYVLWLPNLWLHRLSLALCFQVKLLAAVQLARFAWGRTN